MSGRRSRDKGARIERAIVAALRGHDLTAEKISRTGYAGPDLRVRVLGQDRKVEVKARGHGFGQLYSWLSGSDILVIKADRAEPLVVMPLREAARIAAIVEKQGIPAQRESGRDPLPDETLRHERTQND
jgi:hypothetical protein